MVQFWASYAIGAYGSLMTWEQDRISLWSLASWLPQADAEGGRGIDVWIGWMGLEAFGLAETLEQAFPRMRLLGFCNSGSEADYR